MKKKKKIYKDKHGREYIKESYFVGGKMKYHRIYVIDGMPADEFYEKNATDLDFYMNGDYHLMSSEKDSNHYCNEEVENKSDLLDNDELNDLPF